MLIGNRCTVCHEDIGADDSVTCDVCGSGLHDQCTEYEQTFECLRCSDEPGVGAVEF